MMHTATTTVVILVHRITIFTTVLHINAVKVILLLLQLSQIVNWLIATLNLIKR